MSESGPKGLAMQKEYLPAEVEARWIATWSSQGLFTADPSSASQPFCMVIPPPNVTGDLHIGHVLVYTLHDVIARWRRMQGRDVLWLPGTDHAGIATQMVVERELGRQGLKRVELGREAFERHIWEWKANYGGRITGALRTLGASVDWSRERFTLDEGLSLAVRTVFVRLYEKQLIYRDRFIVNWCPRCSTALSDLETEHKTVNGALYTLRYPAADGGPGVTVATTRPETLFGDTAVAVHPEDPRFGDLIGSMVRVPLTDREVPVVADAFVDPAFGTGAVKITPAHDPFDFHAGRRLGLPSRVALDAQARLTAEAGRFQGLERFEGRRQVVEALEQAELLLARRDHEHAVGHCQRCGTMVEPTVSPQWFVRVEPLARAAIEAVENGRTRFVPESWAKTYFEWMRNIHDWCISRQLWWGHRIPAWHCACGQIQVAEAAPPACPACGGALEQDPDVLDTWFSSALWPFSTLGWPEKTADLARYYPTDLLITGHDIIFFWVARMMMMGLEFMGDVPFREIYIHGLVRDAQGQKMAKTRGNAIHPAEVQTRYGTDAVRFTMAALAAPGNDVPLAAERMEGYRAFVNKLWNATRFVLLKVDGLTPRTPRSDERTIVDRWILSRCESARAEVDEALSTFRFDRAADTLYHFVWHEYCDWYIEMVKLDFQRADDAPDDPAARQRAETAAAVLLDVLGRLLKLLHPFMPFVTEELWQRLPAARGPMALERWPEAETAWVDAEVDAEIQALQEVAARVRHVRKESRIDPARSVELLLQPTGADGPTVWRRHAELLGRLVRALPVRVVEEIPTDLMAARGAIAGVSFAIPLADLLDLDAERERLSREQERVRVDLDQRARRLSDPSFVARAPAAVVEKERRLVHELEVRFEQLGAQLTQLGPAVDRP